MGRRLSARVRAVLVAVAAVSLVASACVSTPTPSGRGTVHVVRAGETVYRISRYYQVRVDDVIRANHIRDVTDVSIGERLFIPGTRRKQPSEPLSIHAGLPPVPAPDMRVLARREDDLAFAWPLRGRVSSRFGRRNGRPHEGIDIPARRGSPVRAAEAGRVIHSGGGLGAYGNVVIIKHSGRYSTVYAHNSRNRVRKGDFVERGQVIAEVGRTGNASGPHLHFEVRRNRRAEDPLSYLPRGDGGPRATSLAEAPGRSTH